MTQKNKGGNDSFHQNSKKGGSDSKLSFIKEDTGFLDELALEAEEEVTEEDLENPEFSDLEQDDIIEEDFIGKIQDVVSGNKESKVTSIKVIPKKLDNTKDKKLESSKEVIKQVNHLIKEISSNITDAEIKSVLELSQKDKEIMSTGGMELSLRGKLSREEKKELISKLEEIKADETVSKANASFVLKWLKSR